jgi:excisionase family DNA binding protein
MTATLLTIAQAARRLGVSESSLRSMIQTGKLPFTRANNHQLLITIDDLAKIQEKPMGTHGKRRAVRRTRS